MSKETLITIEGKVLKVLPNRMCEVLININEKEHTILCFLKGKINKRKDRIAPGIDVEIQIDTRFKAGKGIVLGVKRHNKNDEDFESE